MQSGFRANAGRLGTGVYFTDSKEIAFKIAKHRGLEFVFTCQVALGDTIDFGSSSGNLQSTHDR